jgi:uncharacterized protein (TIGR02265 family)
LDRSSGNVPYSERRVLDTVFDGLLNKALKKEMTPALKQRLVAMGIELDGKFKPLYPHTVWIEMLGVIAQELFPSLSREQAFRELGGRAAIGYFDTVIGIALKQVLRVMGVRRSLTRMAQNFSAANNYTRAEAVDVGPGHVTLWMNELTDTRHNLAGVMETGLTVATGKRVKVAVGEHDEHGTTYDVRWDP